MKKKESLIILKNVTKNYSGRHRNILVLDGVSVEFLSGTFYLIIGHSGNGKSTLINILGLIDSKFDGNYSIYGKEVSTLDDKDLAKIRMQHVGFIFQDFYLDPYLKAIENVLAPMYINENISKESRKSKATELLEKVGLKDRIHHFPRELSGGEQQRVAIARALANDPDIILADEPTGNLDSTNEKMIFEQLKKLSKDGKCVIVVSHSDLAKKYADVVYELDDHKLREVKK